MMQRVFWLIIAVSLIVSTVSTADDKNEESDLDIGSLLQMGKIFQNYQSKLLAALACKVFTYIFFILNCNNLL